jgi:tRNA A-37 threonylcarbamoyl transferase component Bud32
MRPPPVLDALPPGFRAVTGPDEVFVWHEELAAGLVEAGYDAGEDPPYETSELSGRRPLREVRVGDDVFLVRRFHHGGLLRWLTGERFLDIERPFRELVVSARLRERGVRTPPVVAARARRAFPAGYTLEIVTRRIPETTDLGFVVGRAWRGDLSQSLRAKLLRATGTFVAELHDKGLLHDDLTPNNLLVNCDALEGGPVELWVVDLDGAMLDGLTEERRHANLRRLFRFLDRHGEGHSHPFTRADFARFFRGYDPDGRRWKTDWRAILAGYESTRGAHAAGRRLQRLFGGEEHLKSRGLLVDK